MDFSSCYLPVTSFLSLYFHLVICVAVIVDMTMSMYDIVDGCRDSTPGAGLQCSTCKKRYVGREAYLDLTTSSGFKSYGDPMPASTELFRHAHFFPLFSSQSLAQLLKGVALSE